MNGVGGDNTMVIFGYHISDRRKRFRTQSEKTIAVELKGGKAGMSVKEKFKTLPEKPESPVGKE